MWIKEIRNCHIAKISNGWIAEASGEWSNGNIYNPGRIYFKELKDVVKHIEDLEKTK